MKQDKNGFDSVGALIKQYRLDAGLSQGDLAKKLGYTTPQFVSNWERELCQPPAASLGKIAEILGCEPQNFVERCINIMMRVYEKDLRAQAFSKRRSRS
jgi:transcriptional regulator with XRE-family HTH domain